MVKHCAQLCHVVFLFLPVFYCFSVFFFFSIVFVLCFIAAPRVRIKILIMLFSDIWLSELRYNTLGRRVGFLAIKMYNIRCMQVYTSSTHTSFSSSLMRTF